MGRVLSGDREIDRCMTSGSLWFDYGEIKELTGGGRRLRWEGRGLPRGGCRVPLPVLQEDLPDPRSRGAELTGRYCSQRHDTPHPRLHTAEEWPAVAGRMFARMSMMPGMPMMGGVEAPSPAEREAIVAYLAEHGRKG